MQPLESQSIDSEDLPITAVPGLVTAMATTDFVLLSIPCPSAEFRPTLTRS